MRTTKTAKLISLFLVLAMVASLCIIFALPSAAETPDIEWSENTEGFSGGNGTEADPFQIANGKQLAKMAELVNTDTLRVNGFDITGTTETKYASYSVDVITGASTSGTGINRNYNIHYVAEYNGTYYITFAGKLNKSYKILSDYTQTTTIYTVKIEKTTYHLTTLPVVGGEAATLYNYANDGTLTPISGKTMETADGTNFYLTGTPATTGTATTLTGAKLITYKDDDGTEKTIYMVSAKYYYSFASSTYNYISFAGSLYTWMKDKSEFYCRKTEFADDGNGNANLTYTDTISAGNTDVFRYAEAYYKLTDDILLNDNLALLKTDYAYNVDDSIVFKNWTPIGTEAAPFAGNFDGNGKTVSGMRIAGFDHNMGLFGYMRGANIKYLTIKDTYILLGLAVTIYNHGCLAGTALDTNICDCHVSSAYFDLTKANMHNIGGFIGLFGGISTMKNCSVDNMTIDLTAEQGGQGPFGGIIGSTTASSVSVISAVDLEYCSASNLFFIDSSGSSNTMGGIAGTIDSGASLKMYCCSVDTATFAANSQLGGLVGAGKSNPFIVADTCSVVNVKLTITTTADTKSDSAGGIVSYVYATSGHGLQVKNCDIDVDITNTAGKNNIGGIAGYYQAPQYTKNFFILNNRINIKMNQQALNAGGIVGYASTSAKGSAYYVAQNVISGNVDGADATEGILYGKLVFITTSSFTQYKNFYTSDLGPANPVGTATGLPSDLTFTAIPYTDAVSGAVSALNSVASDEIDLSSLETDLFKTEVFKTWVVSEADTPEFAPDVLNLYAASLTLSDALAINLYLDKDSATVAGVATAFVFKDTDNDGVKDDDETESMLTPLLAVYGENSYYKYVISDIKAAEMNADYNITLKVGGKVVQTITYSISDYAENMYVKASSSIELKALLNALMVYGDAAQTAKYGTSEILSAYNTNTAQNLVIADYLAANYNDASLTTASGVDNTYMVSFGLSLTDTICPVITVAGNVGSIKVNFYGKDIVYSTVATEGENNIAIVDRSLTVTSFNNVMTLSFYESADGTGENLGTTNYAISNFIAGAQTSYAAQTDYLNLSQALAVYMLASRAYAGLN